jgi:hypothetical protein
VKSDPATNSSLIGIDERFKLSTQPSCGFISIAQISQSDHFLGRDIFKMPVNLPIHNPFHGHEDSKDHPTPSVAKSSIALDKDASNQSLSTVLSTPELRSALTLLVATVIVQMRGDVTAIFDPRFVTASVPAASVVPAAKAPSVASDGKTAVPSKADVGAAEKARKARESIINELSEKDVQDLKTAVLAYFDKWRDGVVKRIGEVVSSKDEAEKQAAAVEAKAGDGAQKIISERDEDKKITETVTESEGVHHPIKEKSKDSEELVDDSKVIINEQAEKMLQSLYPPVKTDLVTALSDTQRRLVLHAVMLLLLSLEHYTGYSRLLLLHLTSSLNLPLSFLSADESATAKTLLTAVALSADQETKDHEKASSHSRAWKVGLASVAGAAIIGVTGGLAAPLVAAGIGTLMAGVGLEATVAATYLGALAGSEMLIGGLFGAYGGSMAGKAMDEYSRAVSDFAFIPVHGHYHRPRKIQTEYRRLRVCVGITGWLTEREEVVKPWRVITPSMETFALRWELEALMNLGNSLTGVLKSTAWAYAKKKVIEKSILGVLFEALWPLSLIRVAKLIDNPFTIAMARADKAGAVLADALANKVQGSRPVTLVGYSLGARVIYSCLTALANKREFGLIENAVLLGTPASADSEDWRGPRTVVAGRLVNVYSTHDLVLAFAYRGMSLDLGVAGLQAVIGVPGVENVDVSELISGHMRYRFLSGSILKKIGFEDLDVELVEEEEDQMAQLEELEEKEREQREQEEKKEGKTEEELAHEVETDIEKRNKATAMDWAKAKLAESKDKLGDFWKSKDDVKDEKPAHAEAAKPT